jgi:hypothetical protein
MQLVNEFVWVRPPSTLPSHPSHPPHTLTTPQPTASSSALVPTLFLPSPLPPLPFPLQILEDSPRFIAGRANAAVRRYLDDLLPPLAGAMVKYASTNEYSWAAPGHQGGVAFTKNRT